MRITDVEKNKKNPDMLEVFIDGTFAFSILEEDYLALSLYDRENITIEEIDEIKTQINTKKAKAYALRYLTGKLRSENEIRQKLKQYGFDGETRDIVIEHLKGLGYINDRLYVQKFLYDRNKLKPKAKKMLKYELLKKQIDEDIIDEILCEWKLDDATTAENLVNRKFGKYDLNDEKIKKRVFYFLKNRGYSYEIFKHVIEKLAIKNN